MQESIRIRGQIPALTMLTPDGRRVSAWDFKQKRNKVIALLRADSPKAWNFVKQVAAHAQDWKDMDAVGLIVFSKAPGTSFGSLPPEIIAGTDASGHTIVRYLGTEALGPGGGLKRQGVFVADRYGELYAKWIVENDGELPGCTAILKALEQIEVACEECQVSDWPLEG